MRPALTECQRRQAAHSNYSGEQMASDYWWMLPQRTNRGPCSARARPVLCAVNTGDGNAYRYG